MSFASSVRRGLFAATSVAACSSSTAQQAIDPNDPFRCVAHESYSNEREAEIMRPWTEASGSLVFHEAHPNCECGRAGMSVLFTDASTTSESINGNGFSAVIRPNDPKHVRLLLMTDTGEQVVGEVDYGAPIPFRVRFDEQKGTMTFTSGKFTATAKPADLRRSKVYIPCISADVSVADLDAK